MARERELISEIRQAERPKYEMTYSTHADVIVDTIVEFLRQCFQNHPYYTYIPREDSFGPDFDHTKIVIVDKYTEDAVFLPTVTISVDGIQTQWLQFSQSPFNTVLKFEMNSDGSIKRDQEGRPVPSHYEYTGGYNGSVTLFVSAEDTISREELANTLHMIFAESGRDTLYMRGIFIKDVSVGGQTEQPYRNDYIFQQAVTLSIWSEWVRKIPVGPNLEKIGYDMRWLGEELDSPAQQVSYTTPEVFRLDSTAIVETDSGPIEAEFILDKSSIEPPVALIFDGTKWNCSDFWKQVLEEQEVAWNELVDVIEKKDSTTIYIQEAARAVAQAQSARRIVKIQGRRWADGTYSLGDTIVFTDNSVNLRKYSSERLIYHTDVNSTDTEVVFRSSKSNNSKPFLVVRDGLLYKRIKDVDTLIPTLPETYLEGSSFDNMSARDLLLILTFGSQNIKYPIGTLVDQIDDLIIELDGETLKKEKLEDLKESYLSVIEKLLIRKSVESIVEFNIS